MAKNKIITTQGNVQFINSKGRTINVHPWHVYSVYEGDTVSFLFLGMKDYSGQAFFASQYEDLEVNGETYDNMEDLKNAVSEAFAKSGAQARTEIVTELPEDPYTNTIYLLPKEHGEGFDEYIWNEDEGWQLIGDTDIEWERYLKIADFNVYSAATAEEIAYISGAVDTNADHIVALSGAVDYVSGAVDTEVARAISAETDLQTAINNETSRATSAETTLQNNIDSANARIDAEQIARATADNALSGAIDTEVARATSAETALQTAIDNEASARTEADATLQSNIDDEVSARTEAISAEASARTAADNALGIRVDNEISARTSADTALQTAVDNEASARTDADTALGVRIDTDVIASAEYDSTAVTINFYNISGDVLSTIDASDFIIDGFVEDVRIEDGYLVIDFNTATGIEDIQIPLTDIFNPENYYDKDAVDAIVSGINVSIANEVSARTEADNTLQGNIDTVSGNVETEASRALSAETELQTAINNEVSARTEAINAVTEEISNLGDSLSAYSTTVEMNAAIDAAVSGKADSSAVYTKSEVDNAISAATDDMATQTWVGQQGYLTQHQDISGKQDVSGMTAYTEVSAFTAHTGDSTIHVTTAQTASWDAKSDFSGSYNDLTDKPTIPTVPTSNTAFTNDAGYITEDALSGYAESSAVTEEITAAVSGLQETLTAGTNIDITNNVISVTGISIETSSAITSGDTNAVQGGVLWDELRIPGKVESGLTLEWELYDGGSTTNYPSGQCSKIIFENIDTTDELENGFNFNSSEGDILGFIVIDVNDGVITVSQNNNVTYSISGNNVTVEYPSIAANVDHIYASYDNYWTTTAFVNSTVYTPLINQVSANTSAINDLVEGDEVTARALIDLNDKFGGLKLQKITQSAYDSLIVKDANTLYIIVN